MTDTVIAYDSARPQLIPANPAAVFPYCDGRYAWGHGEFPHALWRYYTVLGNPVADIADFEPGCIWPGSALRRWAEERRARNATADLTVYTDRTNFADAMLALAGFDWHLGLATLDGTKPTSYGGKACRYVQYTDRLGEFDMSIVYDVGWLNKLT
jgi:hypothetical protein